MPTDHRSAAVDVPGLGTLAAALLHVPASVRAEFEPTRIVEFVDEDHRPHRMYVDRFTGQVMRDVVLAQVEIHEFGVGVVETYWVEE